MRKILFLILFLFCVNQGFCVEILDDSIDSEIRQEYNLQESTLPPIPKGVATPTQEVQHRPIYTPTGKQYVVKSGTKIQLISTSIIADTLPINAQVSFYNKEGFVAKDGTIIPAGTVFKGRILNSHTPQITGNGGLIELSINEVYFNGVKSQIETKLSKANERKVFLGDIKGERKYWQNFSKSMKVGKKVYAVSRQCASDMWMIPVVNVAAPIPMIAGSVVYAGNLVVAPCISFFKKGGHVSIPQGSVFEVKFTSDTLIKG